MGRRSVPTDLLRNIELLVGVALPLFLAGVWVQDHLTGSGHWSHPLESAFFEWLALVPLLVLIGIVHSVGLALVVALWPRAANRGVVILGSMPLVPLLMLAGRPLGLLARYALPLAIALLVYGWASHIPGSREPPGEDERTGPVRRDELLGAAARVTPSPAPVVDEHPGLPPGEVRERPSAVRR